MHRSYSMFLVAIQQVHAMSPETLNISHFTFLLAKVAEIVGAGLQKMLG